MVNALPNSSVYFFNLKQFMVNAMSGSRAFRVTLLRWLEYVGSRLINLDRIAVAASTFAILKSLCCQCFGDFRGVKIICFQ